MAKVPGFNLADLVSLRGLDRSYDYIVEQLVASTIHKRGEGRDISLTLPSSFSETPKTGGLSCDLTQSLGVGKFINPATLGG